MATLTEEWPKTIWKICRRCRISFTTDNKRHRICGQCADDTYGVDKHD